MQKDIVDTIKDGDSLRNYTSYLYLKEFSNTATTQTFTLNENATDKQKKLIGKLKILYDKLNEKCVDYDRTYAYGDLYTDFLTTLENSIEILTQEDVEKLDNLVLKVYENDNESLVASYKVVKQALDEKEPKETIQERGALSDEQLNEEKLKMKGQYYQDPKKIIGNFLRPKDSKKINKITPQDVGSVFSRLRSVIGRTFKPQLLASIPSLIKYKHTENNPMKIIRMGTQAQIRNYKKAVSPTYKRYLEIKKSIQKPIIYFNALDLNGGSGVQGFREGQMSTALHELDKENEVAVITFPTDKGVMAHSLLSNNKQTIPITDVFKTLSETVLDVTDEIKLPDYKMSKWVKDKLLEGEDGEKYIAELINKSIKKLGLEGRTNVSPAERQAIFFHFFKFELTNEIIKKLNPETVNFSCKDGIDRGGISCAYYTLIDSIESKTPMTEAEFIRALHAAPALVKGRGMNDNVHRLWNVLNLYVQNKKKNQEPVPDWLTKWCDTNAPKNTKLELVKRLDAYITVRNFEVKKSENFHSENKIVKVTDIFNRDKTQYNTGFGKYSADEKIAVALKMKKFLQGEKVESFTDHDLKLLNDGRLKSIFNDIKKAGLYSKQPVDNIENNFANSM